MTLLRPHRRKKEEFCTAADVAEFGKGQLIYEETLLETSHLQADWPSSVSPRTAMHTAECGYPSLYPHQAESAQAILDGRDVLLMSPTASGKTLSYMVPFYEKLQKNPNQTFICIFPTKALAHSKQLEFEDFFKGFRVRTYDGDTAKLDRYAIRQTPPHIIIFTPELFHQSFLGQHRQWESIFFRIGGIVLDEIHLFKGAFGANFSWVMTRFFRLCEITYKVKVSALGCSATIKDPQSVASHFLRNPVIINAPQFRRSNQHFFVVASQRPLDAAKEAIQKLILNNKKAIVYANSQQEVENLGRMCRAFLDDNEIFAYRAGFTQLERHALEKRLENGTFKVVISTSALEIGLNICDLHGAVIVGYPENASSFMQRIGRVGRDEHESIVYYIPKFTPTDQLFRQFPERCLSEEVDSVSFNRNHPSIARKHLRLAAAEEPITKREELYKSEINELRILERRGLMTTKFGAFYTKLPLPMVNLREQDISFDLIHSETLKVIGHTNWKRTLSEIFLGASYLHQGQPFTVVDIRIREKQIHVEPSTAEKVAVKPIVHHSVDPSNPTVFFDSFIKYENGFIAELDLNYWSRILGSVQSRVFTPLRAPVHHSFTKATSLCIPLGREDEYPKYQVAIENVVSFFRKLSIVAESSLQIIPKMYQAESRKYYVAYIIDTTAGASQSEEFFKRFSEAITSFIKVLQRCECKDGCAECLSGKLNTHTPKFEIIIYLQQLLKVAVRESIQELPYFRRCSSVESNETPIFVEFEATQTRIKKITARYSADTQARIFTEDQIDDFLSLLNYSPIMIGYDIKSQLQVLSTYLPDERFYSEFISIKDSVKLLPGGSLNRAIEGTLQQVLSEDASLRVEQLSALYKHGLQFHSIELSTSNTPQPTGPALWSKN